MRSSEKLDIIIEPIRFGDKEKLWVRIKHKKSGFQFIPSFEDLYRIIQAICNCEDEKYPDGKGRLMVQEFLWDSCDPDFSFELLALKYQLPFRRQP